MNGPGGPQWGIQNFPDGILHNFCLKLHENESNWTWEGGVCSSYPLDPPLSTVISLYAQTLPLTCEVYPSSVRCECVR